MKQQQTNARRLNIWRLFLVSVLLIELAYATIWERKIMWDFIYQHWSALLDAAYKLSGIALVIGLFFAYQQYKKIAEQTKTQVELAKTNANREALCLAAQQCDHFGRELMKKSGELHRAMREKKCEFLARVKVTITENQITSDASGLRTEDNKKIAEHAHDIAIVLNSIEGFAIYFASNVADDNIGYIECGRSFVKHFEDNFALYCINSHTDEYFKATQALYWHWKNRLKTENLVKKHEELSKQISITRQQIDPAKLKPNNPVGT